MPEYVEPCRGRLREDKKGREVLERVRQSAAPVPDAVRRGEPTDHDLRR